MLPASKPSGYCITIICPCPCRLLKKAHLSAVGGLARSRGAAAYGPSTPRAGNPFGWVPSLRMGTRRAALHLDLLEQPGRKRVFSILLERRSVLSGSCGSERASSTAHDRR